MTSKHRCCHVNLVLLHGNSGSPQTASNDAPVLKMHAYGKCLLCWWQSNKLALSYNASSLTTCTVLCRKAVAQVTRQLHWRTSDHRNTSPLLMLKACALPHPPRLARPLYSLEGALAYPLSSTVARLTQRVGHAPGCGPPDWLKSRSAAKATFSNACCILLRSA